VKPLANSLNNFRADDPDVPPRGRRPRRPGRVWRRRDRWSARRSVRRTVHEDLVGREVDDLSGGGGRGPSHAGLDQFDDVDFWGAARHQLVGLTDLEEGTYVA
jgi:hypothetical protein